MRSVVAPLLTLVLFVSLCPCPASAQGRLPAKAGPLLKTFWLLEVGVDDAPVGAVVRGADGGVVVVRDSLGGLLREAERGGVERVELAWPLEVQLEEGIKAVGLAPGLSERREGEGTGEGVLVGIIDTGIDWEHPAFSGDEGPRIAWLLDLNLAERAGRHPGVDAHGGALWSREEIAGALRGELDILSKDTAGHGTHVAGIIGGRAGDSTSDGVAPDVDLIVVKASRGEGVELDEASVIEGILFVLERAEEMGRPVVVNLSLGGHSGPHDGSTDFEKRLQGLFSRVEGRVLVTAAGNDGGRDIHASGSIDGLKTIPVVVPVYERTDVVPGFLVMDLWYRPGSEVEVELISPDGRTSGSASLGETAQLIDGRRGSVSVSHASPQEAHEGLVEVVLLIQEPVSGPLVSGDYQVLLRGQGSFDAWIVRRGPFKGRFGGSIDVDTRLTVPGTVGAALSVGAYNSRSGWVAQNGREIELDLPVGAPSFFSGTGPTLDGRLKPDFLAPGSIVVSALSNDADPLTNPASIFAGALSAGVDPVVEGGRQASTQGTSMAAAFVAGAAALLLEQDGGRTSEEVADLLRATAVPPALGPETLWDPRAGQGLVMVSRALRLGAGERGGSISPSLSSVGVSRDVLYGRDGGLVCVVARAESGLPTEPGWTPEVEVVTESGQVILGEAAPYGEHAVLIPIGRGTARGRGTVHVSIDGVPLDDAPTVTFATARGEVESGQAGRVRGGQCSMSPSGLPPRPNHWLCMALVLVAARVRTVRG